MADDQELTAMTAIARALEPLDEGARSRALGWAAAKFGLSVAATSRGTPAASTPASTQEFTEFAELFAAADPKTDKGRALVAAYWTQVCENQANFPSQSLNAKLKDLGHGIGNITDALDALKDEKPSLILQLKKSGTAKQARKTYRLTQEGVKRVMQMAKGESI